MIASVSAITRSSSTTKTLGLTCVFILGNPLVRSNVDYIGSGGVLLTVRQPGRYLATAGRFPAARDWDEKTTSRFASVLPLSALRTPVPSPTKQPKPLSMAVFAGTTSCCPRANYLRNGAY